MFPFQFFGMQVQNLCGVRVSSFQHTNISKQAFQRKLVEERSIQGQIRADQRYKPLAREDLPHSVACMVLAMDWAKCCVSRHGDSVPRKETCMGERSRDTLPASAEHHKAMSPIRSFSQTNHVGVRNFLEPPGNSIWHCRACHSFCSLWCPSPVVCLSWRMSVPLSNVPQRYPKLTRAYTHNIIQREWA
jgi:hypothetical protein